MPEWEYLKVEGAQPNAQSDLRPISDVLNELGEQGWELTAVRARKDNPQEVNAFLKKPTGS